VSEVKKASPDTKIYIWTGYLYKDLLRKYDPQITEILNNTFCLLDGPFNEELKDLTLQMRGSSNQRLLYLN
jgi:anaerobic ribonucleoside-triphosphate reductase activating protein